MNDTYHTIATESVSEIKVKGSRFIARTRLASTVEEARSQLEEIRKQEHAATHNCYAYIVGVPKENARFKRSDDGEPGGTAGKPIYDVINGSKVTNLLLVVTRYFGGTKLGSGGLVKAYSESAGLALAKSGVKENFITDHLRVEIDFSIYDSLKKVAHRHGAIETQADYSDRVALDYQIRQSRTAQFMAEINELSKGQAKIEKD
ncbi:MAG: YigZ family protein [Candidatus Zixiibacteriota bacterium]|nr:MAG: YigZ family protein [candidate division Zixibacteria bacterium]